TTANANTFIGYASNGAAGITNATAIGANASVTTSNSLVLGSGANVGIGTTAPQGALDVVSTTGGLIVPRMTTSQRTTLTAVKGMIVYDTDLDQFFHYGGAV